MGAEVLPGEPVLVQLLQVVVFETLVTSILKDIPKDPSVVGTVREIVRDHAEDEGRHHAYFAAFFKELCQGTPALRVRAARCLPELVSRSLTPDLVPVRGSLGAEGWTTRPCARSSPTATPRATAGRRPGFRTAHLSLVRICRSTERGRGSGRLHVRGLL
ncbi:diiron oxygenase [Streptomyces sp. NPDC048415]|uniref:diiron oxygenase n=1 Tax=Streptomyces sp. NPDC048415 TaxID=3154822 RepID=UPI0034140872